MLTRCVSVFHMFLITDGRHFPTQQQVLRSASLNVARLFYVPQEPTLHYASPSPQKPKFSLRTLLGRVCGGQSGIGLDIPLSIPAFPLSVSFHHWSILSSTLMLLLSEGQAAVACETSNIGTLKSSKYKFDSHSMTISIYGKL